VTASDLSEWIALFQMELTPDGGGGYSELPPAAITPDRPAHVRKVSGQEMAGADQLAGRSRYDVTIRYEPGITIAWRVLWRDQLLDVTDVDNPGNGNAWLKLKCERRELGTQ
jgi:SPP1 family predicted phage head-tail adaptor